MFDAFAITAPDTTSTIEINTVYPTGRTIGGQTEYMALMEWVLANHTSEDTINVPAPSDFTGPITSILAMAGGADNGVLFQGLEDASGDISAEDMVVNRTTGAIAHTFTGDWSGYTMRMTMRWLEN